MKCPSCYTDQKGQIGQTVMDSAPRKDGTTYRRRYCATCKVSFKTVEMTVKMYRTILKGLANVEANARFNGLFEDQKERVDDRGSNQDCKGAC